jgi:hypothetical protein
LIDHECPTREGGVFRRNFLTGTDRIETWQHLDKVRLNVDANFRPVADLNASTAGYESVANASANDDKGVNPIGNKKQATPTMPVTAVV